MKVKTILLAAMTACSFCLPTGLARADYLSPVVSLDDVYYSQGGLMTYATAAHGFIEGTVKADGEPLLTYLNDGGSVDIATEGGSVQINIDQMFGSNDNKPELVNGKYEVQAGDTIDLVVGDAIGNVQWDFKAKIDAQENVGALISTADFENTGTIDLSEAIHGTWVVVLKANKYFGAYAFRDLDAVNQFQFNTAAFNGKNGADLSNASLFMMQARVIPEPSCFGIFALGCLGLCGSTLRRRRNSP